MIDKNNDIDDEEDGEEDKNQTSKASKKKMLLIILPILIIIGLVVSFYTVFNTKKDTTSQNYRIVEDASEDNTPLTNSTIFYDLPEIDVLLNSKTNQQQRLKLQINLETQNIDAQKVHILEAFIPRINDLIISHLIELYPEEIQSSEGLYWLKEELLHRINLVTHPILISNISFKSIEIQK